MKFDWEKQELLCERYNIILTDYLTKEEKVKKVLGKFTITNINLGITKFNKGMDGFMKILDSPTPKRTRGSKSYREPKEKPTKIPSLWGKQEKFRL